ncbi:hypothetical protein LAZ67_18000279 [Cordylochernes scorpioides]|uniref:Uncharacterized protein n=1 Tax=Cordylochernes scorpioides TaxID=51811 RepID=A0ABY6LET6_9ARAC|nr:hypothetical protein LAZ67_18000279 [Cordylochernes scorpioides]
MTSIVNVGSATAQNVTRISLQDETFTAGCLGEKDGRGTGNRLLPPSQRMEKLAVIREVVAKEMGFREIEAAAARDKKNMPRRSRPLIGRNTAASRRYRNAIAIETPLQSETRRALRRLRYSEARVAAAKTMQVPVQRIQLWTHKPFSGLQYNTHIDYKADSSVDIGQMSRVCQFCSALRF